MTPYLSKLAMAALHDETVTRIWMQASMTRMKKLPPLNKLLSKKTGQDAGMRLKAALIGISEKEKGK
mgnify:CR=1 FL=1